MCIPSYKANGRFTVQSAKHLLLVLLLLPVLGVSGQNLNNPNRPGPLGTQVNTLTGNLFITRTDINIPARGFDLAVRFAYNSFNHAQDDGFGKGWSFKYNLYYKDDTLPGGKILVWGDGREDTYDSLAGGTYKTPRGFFSTLRQYSPGRLVLTEKDSTAYYFNDPAHRKITRLQNSNGNFIQFNYTGSQLTSMVNEAGQTISFTYDGAGRLATVLDAVTSPARTFTYRYDAAGNLTEVQDPLGGKYTYTYLINGPMKTLSDKNNNTVDIIYFPDFSTREIVGCNKRMSFSYDTTLQKTVVTDYGQDGQNQVTTYTYKKLDNLSWLTSTKGNCCGFNMTYEYDDWGNLLSETDANGNTYTFTYDGRGNLRTATDPLGGAVTYTYSAAFNKISSFRDENGNRYALEYDSKGNLVKLTAPDNQVYTATYGSHGDILTSTNAKGAVFTYSYDAFGNPVQVTGPNGFSATLAYDARGNLLTVVDARGSTHEVEYDILDRLKKITDPMNHTVQYGYDAAGNIVSLKDKNNKTSSFGYDASNRMTTITGPTGNKASLGYDAFDNITSMKDPLDHVSTFAYDTRNRLQAWKDALGDQSDYSYDANGNLTSAVLPNGRTVTFTYDKLDRLAKVSDNAGEMAFYTYDAAGNVLRYKNGAGGEYSVQYDSRNRPVQVVDPLGNITRYAYDTNGNVASVTDRNGFTRSFTYDGFGRVKTYTDNNGFVTSVTYDGRGNLTGLTDQNGNTTTYTFDELNRRKTMTFPDGSFQQYAYDANGNLASQRLTDGSTITFGYDALDRMITKTLPGGEVYTYTYDKMGRVTSASIRHDTVQIAYDALGRVVSETAGGRTVLTGYNTAGRTQATTYPDGSEVVKEFDTRNRLSRILKDGVVVVEYAYNNVNQLTSQRLANGVQTIRQYDVANRLVSLTTAGGTIQQLRYTYDKEGNKKTITNLVNPLLNETFTYDKGYRLTNFQQGSQQSSFTYDAAGNRLSAIFNGVTNTYTVNNLNQLTSRNGVGLTYDGRGNLTFDGQFYKTYDAGNRLIKDSSSPAAVITYGYDAFGRRVLKSINGVPLKYTYSKAEQIEERDGAGAVVNQTVFASFLSPVLQENGGNAYYYHQNELLSVEAITNAGGRLLEHYQYDVYGRLKRFDSLNNPITASLAGNRFGFTGQEWDSATNSYRFYYRHYTPELGVFNQRDLIEYKDGTGLYQYVGNNPANGIDVWGLQDCGESGETTTTTTNVKMEVINQYNNLTSVWTVTESFGNTLNNPLVSTFLLPLNVINTADAASSLSNYQTNSAAENTQAVMNLTSGGSATGVGLIGTAAYGAGATNLLAAGGTAGEAFAAGGTASTTALTGGVGSALVPLAGGLALAGIADKGWQTLTGETFAETGQNGEVFLFTDGVRNFYDNSSEEYSEMYKLYVNDPKRLAFFLKTRERMENRQRRWRANHPCPPGGTRKPPRGYGETDGSTTWVASMDPNEITGPDGVGSKKWVSTKDRMPYTIRFENDTSATAPANVVRITTPLHPKQDATSFELGSFGFNNQTFDVPANTASYYQRLDCRDSLGLYVDVTAGYDPVAAEAFWEFRSIDPLTLLPNENPEKGMLLLQDTSKGLNGHGFVNFSIKPQTSAATRDTTAASALIVFDGNESIGTNVWVNTLDALAPVSNMQAPVAAHGTATLRWSGADDVGGSGLKHYALYVSDDGTNFSLLRNEIIRTDTTIVLAGGTYYFFVLATDSVGNTELLRPGAVKSVFMSGSPLPVTWLTFSGKTVGRDNHLQWSTATEQNSREFRVQRSLNGSDYTTIGAVAAAGNSSSARAYQYTDRNIDKLNSPVMYYRLAQADRDGRLTLSSIVRLTYQENNIQPSLVYPNPTGGQVTVTLGDRALLGTQALLYDQSGKLLQSVRITGQSQTFNLSLYGNGTYYIRLQNKEVLKVIKQ